MEEISIKDKLSMNLERDKILYHNIKECDVILNNLKGNYYHSKINMVLRFLRIVFRVKETKCVDGIYTSFDSDELFIEDLITAVQKRKDRIENHAKNFTIN